MRYRGRSKSRIEAKSGTRQMKSIVTIVKDWYEFLFLLITGLKQQQFF